MVDNPKEAVQKFVERQIILAEVNLKRGDHIQFAAAQQRTFGAIKLARELEIIDDDEMSVLYDLM